MGKSLGWWLFRPTHVVPTAPVENAIRKHHLAMNAGRVIVHEELLRRVWGPGYATDTQLLHTAVRRLRRKIEMDPAAPRHILTRHGIGYSLARGT